MSALRRTALKVVAVIRHERGIALPMAMFSLLLLTSLLMAFLMLGESEPVIVNNQLRAAQARVLAEAGVERVIWALSNSAASGGLTAPEAGRVAASPYDGLTFFTLTSATGGFTVKVTGVSTTEVTVETEGWTPTVGRAAVTTYDAADVRTKAHRKILTNVIKYPDFGVDTNCALCVNGDVEVRGSAIISSNDDISCGRKLGVTTSGTLCIGGSPSCNGNSGDIFGGADGDPKGNGVENEASDYQTSAPASQFSGYTLSTAQLAALRQQARDNGSYYSGDTTFNSSNKVPSGKPIVFVDGNMSTSGNPYTGDTFNGWMIVIGSASVNGNGTLNGMLYTTNDLSSSSGTNTINGLVISQNTTNATGIDTSAGGNMRINFNCANARGSSQIAQQWFPKAGSWTEPSG